MSTTPPGSPPGSGTGTGTGTGGNGDGVSQNISTPTTPRASSRMIPVGAGGWTYMQNLVNQSPNEQDEGLNDRVARMNLSVPSTPGKEGQSTGGPVGSVQATPVKFKIPTTPEKTRAINIFKNPLDELKKKANNTPPKMPPVFLPPPSPTVLNPPIPTVEAIPDEDNRGPKPLAARKPDEGADWAHHPSKKRNPFSGDVVNHEAIDNQERNEAYVLAPGEKKVEEKIDTRTPNTSIFTFNKEDHTLGNLLRHKLLMNSHVTFAAYRIPHPLFATFELRVQTDGEVTPKEAVIATCAELINETTQLKNNFIREYELRKMVGNAQNGN